MRQNQKLALVAAFLVGVWLGSLPTVTPAVRSFSNRVVGY
jgi:hypothetical protein